MLSHNHLILYNFYLSPVQVPRNWEIVTLNDLSYVVTDGTHKTPEYKTSGIRFISIKNIRPFKSINWQSYERYISQEEHKQLINRCNPEYDDILFPRIGTLGFAKRIDFKEEISIFVGLGLIKPIKKYVNSKFIEYYFNTPYIKHLSEKKANGTGRKTLPLEESRRFPVPLPPLAEQHRIVEKIEELFSDLDKGIESLKATQQQLKIYRQAVLKWAFEGKLTAKWREEKKHKGELKSADELLDQIKAEREKRDRTQLQEWHEAVKTWEANGKQGKKPGKPKKAREVEALIKANTDSLFEVPKSWCWVKLGEITEVSGGVTKNAQKNLLSLKLPYIRVANVYANQLDLGEILEIGLRENEVGRVLLKKNDLLVVEGNGSIEQIGRVAIWNGAIEPCVHQNHIIKARAIKCLNIKFILHFLLSHQGREFIKKEAASTSGLYTLSLSKVENLKIPLSSIEEQDQIVQEIEFRLSICDRLEATITENLTRAEALRQSILKQAFEGKLVPQDPNDEPAEKLIERIRQEKLNGKNGKQLELEVFVDVENKLKT